MGEKRVYDSTLDVLFTVIDSISKSKYASYCVLLGGTAFIARLCEVCEIESLRQTYDIDLDMPEIRILESFISDIKTILNNNVRGFVFDSVRVERRSDTTCNISSYVYENGEYLCRVYLDLNVANFNTIKFSFMPTIGMNAYDLQTMVVDKMSVFYSDTVFRRIKGIIDLSILSQASNYSSTELIGIMEARNSGFFGKSKIAINASTLGRLVKGYSVYRGKSMKDSMVQVTMLNDACVAFGEAVYTKSYGYIWNCKEMRWVGEGSC